MYSWPNRGDKSSDPFTALAPCTASWRRTWYVAIRSGASFPQQPRKRRPIQTDPNAQQPATTAPETPGNTNARPKPKPGQPAPVPEGDDRCHGHSPRASRTRSRSSARDSSVVEAVSGRGDRQTARRLDCRIYRPPPRGCRSARRRARSYDLRSRLLARFHDGATERPSAGKLGLQPRGRIRSISLRTARLGRRLHKTPDADIAGMGLAGTVDLRTIRPLEYGKRAIALNLRGQYDEGGGRNSGFLQTWMARKRELHRPERGRHARLDDRLCSPRRAEPCRSHQELVSTTITPSLLPDGTPYILSGEELCAI